MNSAIIGVSGPESFSLISPVSAAANLAGYLLAGCTSQSSLALVRLVCRRLTLSNTTADAQVVVRRIP